MATTAIGSTAATTSTTTASQTLSADQLAASNRANAQQILTSLGAGSGVDTASLAQNLVNAEKVPQENAINAKITKNDSKVSGMSAVMFMMSEMQKAFTAVKDKNSFNTVTVGNTNPAAVSVTAAAGAVAGDHQIVVNSVSQAQRSVSVGFAASDKPINSGNPFALTLTASNDAVVGSTLSYGTYTASIAAPAFGSNPSVNDFKTFSVTVDGKTFQITPTPTKPTLNDLAIDLQKQLRSQDGSDDLSVVYDGNGIVVSSSNTTRVVTAPSLSKSTVINLDTGANQGVGNTDTITGAAFGVNPAVNDFDTFNVTLGDTVRSIYPAPITATMGDLAANIQSQLRALDGNDDVTVTYDKSTGLKVQSASGRNVSNISLTKKTYADTPSGIVAAINAANRGYRAQLINDGSASPYKIMISGASGASEGFSISSDDTVNNLGQSFVIPTGSAATDAIVTVDGVSYARKSNTITDIVPGVTLNLKAVSASPAGVTLTRDVSDLKSKLTALVTAYNDFDNIIKETTNPKSTLDTYGKTLVGDSTVRMIRQQMRSLIFGVSSTPGNTYKSLSQLGFSLDQTGVLSLDAAKLDTALANGVDDIAKMFTGGYNNMSALAKLPAGLAGDAVRTITNLLSPTGILVTKTNNANTENDKYRAQLTKLQSRMDILLARYQKQFSAMNSMVGSVNSQKTSLKSTFDGMMAMYTNKN